MSEEVTGAGVSPEPSPEAVVHLLDVVAEHGADHVLTDMGQLITRLRADVERAVLARYELTHISADVLREAIRLRTARTTSPITSSATSPTAKRIESGDARFDDRCDGWVKPRVDNQRIVIHDIEDDR